MKLKALTKSDLKTSAKNIFLVIIGTVILAFGTSLFILPNNLVIGGVSGLGIILHAVLPTIKYLTVELLITILTWLLFFMGLFILGRSFAAKTLVSTIVYPPAISIFTKLIESDFVDGFFYLDQSSTADLMLSAIFFGILCGVGCAITFIGGGSTGGSDIIGFIVSKFFKRIKSSVSIGVADGLIVVLGIFCIKNFILTLCGVIAVAISTIVIDKVFIGSSKAFVAQIITEKHEEINKAVIEELERTTTVMDVVGGYSGSAYKMLMVSFSMREYSEILNVINRYDRKAFVTIHRAHEINGEGWTW